MILGLRRTVYDLPIFAYLYTLGQEIDPIFFILDQYIPLGL